MAVTPQVFDPTLTSPFSQPFFYSSIGPYQHGSDLYWVCDGYDTGTGLEHLVVYKLSSGTFTKIVAGFANSNHSGAASVYWPGTGTVLYIAWQGREVSANTGHLHTTTFDMATDSFGTDNDSTVISSGSIQMVRDASGNLILCYDTSCDSAGAPLGAREVRFLVYNGAWSAANVISPTSGTNSMDVVVVDGTGVVWLFWDDATNLKIVLITAGTAGASSTIIAIPANFQTTFPYSAIYDAHLDKVVWVYTSGVFGTRQINTLVSSAAAPSFSVVLVADDATNQFFWDQVSIAADGIGNYSVLTWSQSTAPLDGILARFTSTDLATWSGPTTYYDEEAQPPSPAPAAIELYPIWARYLADGSFHVTVGMFYPIVGSTTFCGVLVYLAPVAVPVQTLQLIKQVSGGTAVATDFTLTATGPTTISGAGGVGPSNVDAGTYTLSETSVVDYSAGVWVCVGGTQAGDQITLIAGQTAVCTIINTFSGIVPPPPPDTCIVFAPTTPAPSLVAYDEPVELKGS